MAEGSINEATLVSGNNENVTVTIKDSVVNVIGINHGNVQTNDGKSVEQNEGSQDKSRLDRELATSNSSAAGKNKELCKIINANTIRKTKVIVTEDFKNENLREPTFEVYPQMKKVKDYFKGGYEKLDDMEIEVIKRRFFRKPKRKILRNQTRKEVGFKYKNQPGDAAISSHDLLESITTEKQFQPDESNPVTAVVASAGSGKTTLLRRLARQCVNLCPLTHQESEPPEKNSHLKMVHYVEMKNLKYQKKMKVSNFLFGGLFKNESDEDEAFQWLQDHQSEAVLYFDGLDQATWSIKSRQRIIRPFETANSTEIMYNILSRDLIPHVKIVISSREFRVSELPAEARPDDIISLVGLKKGDASKLFVNLIGDQGQELWNTMERMSPKLINVVSIPVFLLLTAAVMVNDPSNPPPSTITELYNRVLLSLSRVENIQERSKIGDIIKKLKAMAHQGMMEGRVVFYESDLKKYALSILDVRDLMMKVPGNNLLSRHLLEGDFVFFFCHQSFQEFLSASFVAGMNGRKFIVFNDKYLHESRWSVVRTFVSGIIHDETRIQLHEVPAAKKKQAVFGQAIQAQIKKWQRGSRGLGVELLAALYESNNDDLIQSSPHLPSLAGTRLGQDDAFMLGSILARRPNVKEALLHLRFCGVDDELLNIIVHSLKDQKISVGLLNLRLNTFTEKGLNKILENVNADRIHLDCDLLKGYQYDNLNWENIRVIDWIWAGSIQMINKEEIIAIEQKYGGYFTKQERTLSLFAGSCSGSEKVLDLISFFKPEAFVVEYDNEVSTNPLPFVKMKELQIDEGKGEVPPLIQLENVLIENILRLREYFNPKQVEVTFQNQIYVRMQHLDEMISQKIKGQISKVLLDCRSEENVDSLRVDSCLSRFQVESLDVLVDEITSFTPRKSSWRLRNTRIYWWFEINNMDDVQHFVSTVQANLIDHLLLGRNGNITFDDILAAMEKSGLLADPFNIPPRHRSDNLMKITREESIQVETRARDGREFDAWQIACNRRVPKVLTLKSAQQQDVA